MNRSTPGLPVHHQLPEFTQAHVHRVSDAIHAHALAKLMCQRNKWPDELVYGLLPNGDEVFCFRANGREVNQK